MGYDVHITRRENWSDDGGPAIDASEWEAAVAMVPRLAEFAYFDGDEIVCKDPDDGQLKMLASVAKHLDANVIGDDGEKYTLNSSGGVVSNTPSRQKISRGQSFLRIGLALIAVWGIMFLILWLRGAFG